MALRNRVQLGAGRRSGLPLRHVITNKGIHRIIAGKKIAFKPRDNQWMIEGGTGGSEGTLELYVEGASAEIFREVPRGMQNKGVGTDLLHAVEKLGRQLGLKLVYGRSRNPAAVRSYEKAGWKKAFGIRYEKPLK